MMKTIFTLFLFFISLITQAQINISFEKDSMSGQAPLIAIPDSKGYINDRAHTFSAEEIKKLRAYMVSQKMDSTQITVLTISTIQPFDSLEQLANTYADVWELGKEKNNGVLIIFSAELKKSRIQVGDGIAARFTPEVLKTIDNAMIPEFVNKKYYEGTLKALQLISKQLKNN